MVQYLSRQMKISPNEIDIWKIVLNIKYTNPYVALAIMVKHNTVEGHM